MILSYAKYSIVAVLLGVLTTTQAHSVECDTLVDLGEKPVMDAYADYSDFLVAIMDYKAASRDLQAQQKQCAELFTQQASPKSQDPTITNGPETLDSALARTDQIPKVDYSVHRTWYNRSTSRSFSLPTLASAQLDNESIGTKLRTLVDEPLPEREQQLVLNSLGPLSEEDGKWASQVAERQVTDILSERERGAEIAGFQASNGIITEIRTIYGAGNSYVTLTYSGSELIHVRFFAEGCLGSC